MKRLDTPFAFFNLELTAFILSLTKGCADLDLTSNPAFFKIEISDDSETENLLNSDQYAEICED